MSHYLDNNRLVINNSLKLDLGSQGDNYIISSDSQGKVSWIPVSNLLINSYDHYVGELYGGGVVVSVWRESGLEKCLIASMSDVWIWDFLLDSGIYQFVWSNVITSTAGASYSSSGATNSNIIVSQAGYSSTNTWGIGPWAPAATQCLNYTNLDYGTGVYSDWYLPSIYELGQLTNNLAVINKSLYGFVKDCGGGLLSTDKVDLISNNTIGYWSSTERNSGNAYALQLASSGSLSVSAVHKSTELSVRAFRVQTTPIYV